MRVDREVARKLARSPQEAVAERLIELTPRSALQVSLSVFVAQLLQERDSQESGQSACEACAANGVAPEVLAVWRAYADSLLLEDFAYHPYRHAAADPAGFRAELPESFGGPWWLAS